MDPGEHPFGAGDPSRQAGFEHYVTGPDEHIGHGVADVAFDASTKHDLRSISKSVIALVLGVEIGKGKIAGVDEPVLAQFPE